MVRFFVCLATLLSFCACSSGKNERPLRIGYEAAFFSTNAQTLRMKGFFDALIPLIEKKAGIRLELIQSTDDGALDLLDRKMVDFIFSDVEKNPITESRYFFTSPLIYNGYYLVTQKNDKRSLCELEEKKVLILENSLAATFIACYPRVDFAFYTDDKDAFVRLSKTLCSAVVIPAIDFPTFTNEFQVIGEKLTDQYFRLVALKENDHYEKIKKAVHSLEKEGVIAKLKAQWMLEP